MTRTSKALLTVLLLTALRLPVMWVTAALLPDASQSPTAYCLAVIIQSLLMFALPAWLLVPWRSDALPRRPLHVSAVVLALLAGLLARTALTPLNAWWRALIGVQETLLPVPHTWMETLLQLAALAVIPAFAEEFLFRGALFTSLMDGAPRKTAILLTTLMFALLHASPAGLPGHLAVSLLLTLLMLKTGQIAVPALAHMLYNLLGLYGMQMPAWTALPAIGGLAVLCLLLTRRLPALESPRIARKNALLALLILLGMAALYLVR